MGRAASFDFTQSSPLCGRRQWMNSEPSTGTQRRRREKKDEKLSVCLFPEEYEDGARPLANLGNQVNGEGGGKVVFFEGERGGTVEDSARRLANRLFLHSTFYILHTRKKEGRLPCCDGSTPCGWVQRPICTRHGQEGPDWCFPLRDTCRGSTLLCAGGRYHTVLWRATPGVYFRVKNGHSTVAPGTATHSRRPLLLP